MCSQTTPVKSPGVERLTWTLMNSDQDAGHTHKLSPGHLCIGWSGGALDTRDVSKEGALQPGGSNLRSLRHGSAFSPQCVVLSGLGRIILTNQHAGQCVDLDSSSPLQCSCLENPRDGGAWRAAFYGVAQSRTQLKWLSSSSSSRLKKLMQAPENRIEKLIIFTPTAFLQ